MKTVLPLIIMFFISGCVSLKPRSSSVNPYKKESPLVQKLRVENANLKSQITEYEAQIRDYSGKVEELQIRLDRDQKSSAQRLGQENAELGAYKESVAALIKEKKDLADKVTKLQLENQESQLKLKKANMSLKDLMSLGDGYFDDKKWTKAVAEYQVYREKAKSVNQTKTEDYALATYKIGVCFQELNLKQEAKTFYKSVVKQNAETKAAKYAKYRLEKLK